MLLAVACCWLLLYYILNARCWVLFYTLSLIDYIHKASHLLTLLINSPYSRYSRCSLTSTYSTYNIIYIYIIYSHAIYSHTHTRTHTYTHTHTHTYIHKHRCKTTGRCSSRSSVRWRQMRHWPCASRWSMSTSGPGCVYHTRHTHAVDEYFGAGVRISHTTHTCIYTHMYAYP
jgi:hypothetical protein